jgi:hypothetical protein
MFALGVAATMAGVTTPRLIAAADEVRIAGAARHVSAMFQRTRWEAVRRNASAAVRFAPGATGGYVLAAYVDGNANGVLSRDITSGADPSISPPESIPEKFAGVDFAAGPGVPPVDPAATPPGADPIRLGAGNMAVFSPIGTATAGSVYLTGRSGARYVVRIFGETGRTRILKLNPLTLQWMPISGG